MSSYQLPTVISPLVLMVLCVHLAAGVKFYDEETNPALFTPAAKWRMTHPLLSMVWQAIHSSVRPHQPDREIGRASCRERVLVTV